MKCYVDIFYLSHLVIILLKFYKFNCNYLCFYLSSCIHNRFFHPNKTKRNQLSGFPDYSAATRFGLPDISPIILRHSDWFTELRKIIHNGTAVALCFSKNNKLQLNLLDHLLDHNCSKY